MAVWIVRFLYALPRAFKRPTRCCTSLTICSVDNVAAVRAGEMLEAMLLVPVFRPLITSAGMLGDYELGLLAQEIAHTDGVGFARLIAYRLTGAR